MQTARVTIVPYDAAWQNNFLKIQEEIQAAIGEWILGIEHVGSTAVEGLCAKPCIDLDVIIPDSRVFDRVVQGLASIGYAHEGDLGITGREAFCYTGKPHLQKHHLYVCTQDCAELHRHITFRDFLRANPHAARTYGAVKQEAAARYPNDIDGYMAHKSACIAALYKQCGLA